MLTRIMDWITEIYYRIFPLLGSASLEEILNLGPVLLVNECHIPIQPDSFKYTRGIAYTGGKILNSEIEKYEDSCEFSMSHGETSRKLIDHWGDRKDKNHLKYISKDHSVDFKNAILMSYKLQNGIFKLGWLIPFNLPTKEAGQVHKKGSVVSR